MKGEKVRLIITLHWTGDDINIDDVSYEDANGKVWPAEILKPAVLNEVPLTKNNPSLLIFHHGSPGFMTVVSGGVPRKVPIPQ